MTTIRSLALLAIAAVLAGCSKPPDWKEASKASCWNGNNAEQRMMNLPSPGMSDGKAKDYVSWMAGRGVNAAHVILCNKADGENAGYSIYGGDIDWGVDKNASETMKRRIGMLRAKGWAVVVWLMTDDSSAWNKKLLGDPDRYLADLDKAGLLDEASIVCVGLELSEYASVAEVQRLVAATRKVYKGKVATHDVSGSVRFAHIADIHFHQMKPGASAAQVAAETKRALATGKPVMMFELSRRPARALCEAALAAGAFGVGNW